MTRRGSTISAFSLARASGSRSCRSPCRCSRCCPSDVAPLRAPRRRPHRPAGQGHPRQQPVGRSRRFRGRDLRARVAPCSAGRAATASSTKSAALRPLLQVHAHRTAGRAAPGRPGTARSRRQAPTSLPSAKTWAESTRAAGKRSTSKATASRAIVSNIANPWFAASSMWRSSSRPAGADASTSSSSPAAFRRSAPCGGVSRRK